MFKFRDIELVSEFFDQEYNLSASDIEYIKKQIVIKIERSTIIFQLLFKILRFFAKVEIFITPKNNSKKYFTKIYLNILTKLFVMYKKND